MSPAVADALGAVGRFISGALGAEISGGRVIFVGWAIGFGSAWASGMAAFGPIIPPNLEYLNI